MQRFTTFLLSLACVSPLVASDRYYFNGSQLQLPPVHAPQTVAPTTAPQQAVPTEFVPQTRLEPVEPPTAIQQAGFMVPQNQVQQYHTYATPQSAYQPANQPVFGQPSVPNQQTFPGQPTPFGMSAPGNYGVMNPQFSQPAVPYTGAEIFYGRPPRQLQDTTANKAGSKSGSQKQVNSKGNSKKRNDPATSPQEEPTNVQPGYAVGVQPGHIDSAGLSTAQTGATQVGQQATRGKTDQAGSTAAQAAADKARSDQRVRQFISEQSAPGLSQFGFSQQPLSFHSQNRFQQTALGTSRVPDSKVNQSQLGQNTRGFSFGSQSQAGQHQRFSSGRLTRVVDPAQRQTTSTGNQVRFR